MILPNMTPQEMKDELHKDFKQLYEINMRFLSTGGLKHLRRQGAKFPAYVMKEQRTARGNRYLCNFLLRRRQDVFTLNALESRVALMETKDGLSGVSMVYSGKFQQEVIYVYRPHVYKRYRERMGLTMEGVELIRYFEKRNCDTILHESYVHKEGDIENDVMFTILDGALFGTHQEVDGCHCFIIKTFIANDTMQEGYKSQFNSQYNKTVDEIKETLERYGCENDYQFDYKKRKE